MLLKRNLKTTDVSRLRYVMEEVQSECGKLGAVRTPGLIEFLGMKLNDRDPKIRELTVSSLSYIVSKLDDAKKDERKILQDIARRFAASTSNLALRDASLSVRSETMKLLSELGIPDAIDVLTEIARTTSKGTFKELREPLKEALCHKYDEHAFSKNGLIRDYKPAVREALLDLTESSDREVRQRVDFFLFHFRTGGQSHYPVEAPS
jgi:HEAT repeat protein